MLLCDCNKMQNAIAQCNNYNNLEMYFNADLKNDIQQIAYDSNIYINCT